jgi:multiple sugar transport system permease protein
MKRNNSILYLLIPSLGLLVGLFVFPFFWAFAMGFSNYNLWADAGEGYRFIGFQNYIRLLQDADFYNSLRITLVFLFLALSGHLFLGLLFANLVRTKGIIGRRLVATAMLIPWLTPGLVAAYMWRSVLNVDYGWFNSILETIGLGRVNWLFDYPLLSILIPNWSRGMAVAFLLLSAALEAIPESIYDAAKIDGASGWQTLIHIKIPMISYSILVTLLVSTFGTLLAFDMIYGLTGGGPMAKTEVFSIFIYHEAFRDMALGYAGAFSSVVLIITLALGLIYIRSIRVEI